MIGGGNLQISMFCQLMICSKQQSTKTTTDKLSSLAFRLSIGLCFFRLYGLFCSCYVIHSVSESVSQSGGYNDDWLVGNH